MKFLHYSFAAAIAAILFTAGIGTVHWAFDDQAVVCDSLVPVLPQQPFDYKGIVFPDHIFSLNQGWGDPDSSAIRNFITDEGATLGRVLFYDVKLSASNDVACASCHKQEFAFADNTPFSEGINGAMSVRNSPNLNDIAWALDSSSCLFWDCRETDLEKLVLQPILHEGELGKDMAVLLQKLASNEYYPPLFEQAFGTPAITQERIGSALAQFVTSMISFETKFDKKAPNDFAGFTPSEKAGRELFETSCATFCHVTPHFGTPFFMNNGLDMEYEDQGVGGWTNQPFNNGKFKSPSLRNVALTAPYMHDGRFATLEEVMDFYSEEVQPHPNSDFVWMEGQGFTGFDFTEQEKADLIAFMETLTDPVLTTAEKWSDPFEAVVSGTRSLPLEERVKIFPNPFSDNALVELENAAGKEYTLRLLTAEGQVLRSIKTREASVFLKKNDLPRGVYFLEIQKGDLKKTERLMIN